MKQKKMWKYSIGKRYMMASVLLITCITLVSYLFSAWYMVQSTEKKLLEDYQDALDFSARQVARYQADIEHISTLLVSDEELQKLLAKLPEATDAEKVKSSIRIYQLLRNYELLRSDCICVELFLADGGVYTSDTHNKNSLHSVGDTSWMDRLDWKKNRDFSEPHALLCHEFLYDDIITYSCNIGNYFVNDQKYGKLLIHLKHEALENLVYKTDTEYSWCAILNSEGTALAESGEAVKLDAVSKQKLGSGQQKKQILERKDGWILYDSSLKNGLSVVMYMPKDRLHNEEEGILLFFSILFVVCLVFSLFVMFVISRRLSRPIVALSNAARQISEGKLDVHLQAAHGDEIGTLTESFNQMASSIEIQMQDLKKAERVRANLQMSILMAQINPHFIYNTLNSAIYLSKVGESGQSERLIQLFIQLLQHNMKSGIDGVITTIGEDIQDLKCYIELQQIRYPDRFTFEVRADEKLYNHAVPRLMLQPLVENALNHGVLSKEYGNILLRIDEKDKYIVFEITDDGNGMSEQKVQDILSEREMKRSSHSSRIHSISIGNIRQRLQLIYKDDYLFEIRSKNGKGTTVFIQVPMEFRNIQKEE